MARAAVPSDSFVVLLKGLYQPAVRGPNLGLSAVDLDDGSYSTVAIYPVSGSPGNTNQNKAIGTFYVQFEGDLCAYHIPGAPSRCASQEAISLLSTTGSADGSWKERSN